MKKSNKFFTSVLAGGLLFGGAALGTSALFTDSKTSTNTLTIKSEKVAIDVKEGIWLKNVNDMNGDKIINMQDDPLSQKGIEKSEAGVFDNVKPGDTFTRCILLNNISNKSDVKIDIKQNSDFKELEKYITVDDSFKDGVEAGVDRNGKLPKGASITGYVTIKIADSEEARKAMNGKEFTLSQIYTINATQIAE